MIAIVAVSHSSSSAARSGVAADHANGARRSAAAVQTGCALECACTRSACVRELRLGPVSLSGVEPALRCPSASVSASAAGAGAASALPPPRRSDFLRVPNAILFITGRFLWQVCRADEGVL